MIEEYVQDYYEIKIIGLMEEKDGIPIFGLGNDGYYSFTYTAFVLNFKNECSEIAYQKICENEPDSYYEWLVLDNKNILISLPVTACFLKRHSPFTFNPKAASLEVSEL